MKVTDKDREYALAAAKECNGLNDVVEAIAQAREEGRAELDAERAAHEETAKELSDAWAFSRQSGAEIIALKARLALAEAVCESVDTEDYYLSADPTKLAAWRAAK